MSYSSGVFLGCKVRVQNFCSLQKFSLTMQKFLKPIVRTFQNPSDMKFFVKRISLDIGGKNSKAAKNFTHHAKIFA